MNFGKGLGEIGYYAFGESTSLQETRIHPAIMTIDEKANSDNLNMTKVVFCREIEPSVLAESLQGWWNRGFLKRSLRTYCF